MRKRRLIIAVLSILVLVETSTLALAYANFVSDVSPFTPPAGIIARVNGNPRGETTSGSSITVTVSAPTVGNVEIATIATRNGASPTRTVSTITQTGVTWTKQATSSTTNNHFMGSEIWLGIVNSVASTTVTIGLSGPASMGAVADICEYSGIDTSDSLDQKKSATGLNNPTSTGSTATTTVTNELWVGSIAGKASTQSSPTNEFTLLDGALVSGAKFSLAYLEKIVTSKGTAETGTTLSTSDSWAGCIVTFKSAPVALNLYVSPSGAGSISKDPDRTTYHYGDQVALTVSETAGWTFDHWTGDISGTSKSVTLSVDSDPSVTAVFTQNEYAINVNINPSAAAGTVTPDNLEPYHYGDIVTFSQSPNSDFIFSGWSDDGNTISENREVAVTGNMQVTANYLHKTQLTISCKPDTVSMNGGTVEVGGFLSRLSDDLGVSSKTIDIMYNVGSGDIHLSAVTQEDGSYTTTWDVPSGLQNGGFYVVNAHFDGDTFYEAKDAQTTNISGGGGLFVVPEYLFGGLAALGTCLAGFVAFKKYVNRPKIRKDS